MPTINRPKKTKKVSEKRGKQKDISKIYRSRTWQSLRESYMCDHPLCEMCLAEGVVEGAVECHHKTPISTGGDYCEMCDLAYDYNNLMALCVRHHHEIHKYLRKEPKI